MSPQWNRRDVLKGLVAASTAMIVPMAEGAPRDDAAIASQSVEIQITPVSHHTVRLSVLPVKDGSVAAIPSDGSLVQESWGTPIAKLRSEPAHTIATGTVRLQVTFHPVTITAENDQGEVIQQLKWDEKTGVLSFLTGNMPLFGLGEGGPQFDRRGSIDLMRSGQGGYKLATHGGRVPIPWIIGTAGWAIFFHQPFGTFDFSGPEGAFQPASPGAPLDLFLVTSFDPALIMSEYARITGHAEMPPLWSFGYQQSHRTLCESRRSACRSEDLSRKKAAL